MKISIPKEAVNKIIEDYGCSEDQAIKAYLDAQDRANEAFNDTLTRQLGSSKSDTSSFNVNIYTPREIKEYMDKFVIGQEEYKRRLAIASSYHFSMIKHLHDNSSQTSVKRFRKKNTITAGPSGSGKTYCVEVLGDLLQVPALIIDATDYTEAGYVGKNADDMIRELIDLAPGNNRKDQANFISKYGGLIFIDEFDKKAKDFNLIGHDISREGFQRSVLKLIERKMVPIDNPYSPMHQIHEAIDRHKNSSSDNKGNMVSTENILFILGGSFERTGSGLESIIKKRITSKSRLSEDDAVIVEGFTSVNKSQTGKKSYKNYLKEADADDFIKFGLLPELVGRSPIRTFVNPLSKNDLVRIMKFTEDSILNQYELEFNLFGINCEISNDAIEYVAEKAENKKTGARALISVWESILTDFQFELPGTNFKKLYVNRELCEKPKDELLKMLEKSPFVDFIENFKNEYDIELELDEEVQEYVLSFAEKNNLQISETLRKLLFGASALNYMNISGPYKITREMVEDEKYFDNLFAKWYEEVRVER